MTYKPIAYVREGGAPSELEKHVTDIQGSGLTTVIVGMLHIGNPDDPDKDKTMEFGDFIYNNYPAALIVRGGQFNPPNPDPDPNKAKANNDAIAKWPEQVAKLKQQGSVRSVFLSVGSPPQYWPDFQNIGKMLAQDNGAQLKKNLVALKEAFTIDDRCAIDGFDIDCEETLDQDMQDIVVRFCEMVFDLGFKVTFCPFQTGQESWWQHCMQRLWDLKPSRRVSGWNLQCYAGGHDNATNLAPWLAALAKVVGKEKAPSYLIPGLAVKSATDVCPKRDRLCPSQVEATVAGWKNRELGGVFLWMYDSLNAANSGECGGTNTLANYIEAIKQG